MHYQGRWKHAYHALLNAETGNEFPLVIQHKLNTLRQKLTRKTIEPTSPEIILNNPVMDIDQGDTKSPNPGGARLWDA